MDENEEIKLKILILGDVSVGNTSILYQYAEDYFPEDYISTIGVDYKNKIIIKNKTRINLQIWDTAGQEKYRSLSKSFIKDADGIFFVYDITKKDSFDHIKMWLDESINTNNQFKKMILGNKKDLQSDRKVTISQLNKYYNITNITGMEVSAKTGENIKEAFDALTNLIINDMTKEQIIKKYGKKDIDNQVLNKENNNKIKKGCC